MRYVKAYPRLRITRRFHSVLVTIGPGHRGYEQQRRWTVLLVNRPGDERVLVAGSDDGIFGWVECCDFTEATIKQATGGQP